jgi:uncharacterized RDD family membrane protein YckC
MAKQRIRDVKQGKVKPLDKKETSLTVPYASSAIKIKAFLTDAFMLVMPILYVVFYLIMEGREGFSDNKLLGWCYILSTLIFIQTLFFYFTGQTPGYRAYNLHLIHKNTNEKPRLLVIIFRNISTILSLFTFAWILMFFRRDSKTLHDLLSSTAVIHKPLL